MLAISGALVFATPSRAQNSAEVKSSSAPVVSDQKEKAKLMEATRVSTDDTVRKVAEQETKQKKQKRTAKQPSEKPDEVVEFQPVAQPEPDSKDAAPDQRQSKKSASKSVHGSLYGADGGNTRQSGASVGASAKSGNTHVYVETDRSKSDAPH